MMDRRSFLKGAAVLGAASVLPRFSFAAESGNSNSGRIRVACVGCGGRGTGAMQNLINADKNIQIVALGDLFEDLYLIQIRRCRLSNLITSRWSPYH